MQKQHYVYCDYNGISMIYVNSSIALLRVRNHEMIIYHKVLENRAKLAHYLSTYKVPWNKAKVNYKIYDVMT